MYSFLKSIMIFIFISIVVSICSTHWVLLWFSLELNSIAFCSFLSLDFKEKKMDSNMTFLYYSVQLVSSIFILFLSMNINFISFLIILFLIFMKLGMWPFYKWYLKMIHFMLIDSKSFFFILSVQKVISIIILIHVMLNFSFIPVLTVVLLNMLISSFSLDSLLSTKMVISVSSVNNSGWLSLSILGGFYLFFVFISFYSVVLFLVMKSMLLVGKKIFTEGFVKFMTATLCNLGGIPPFSMFWMKIMVLSWMIFLNLSKEILLLMMLVACLFLYNYFWLVLNSVISSFKKNQNLSLFSCDFYIKVIFMSSFLSFTIQLF